MKSIILIPSKGENENITIEKERPDHNVEQVLKVRKKVYEDIKYKIELSEDIGNKKVAVYINGDKIDTYVEDSKIIPYSDDAYIFMNIYGFAQISLCITDDRTDSWYFSEFLSVLVKPNKKNRSVNSMIKFIYENQEDYLYYNSYKASLGSGKTSHDFWSQIILLEEIANTYEDNYGYFMANSRYKLDKIEVFDRIEKLQYVDGKTIQYIVQHPENLDRNVVGIKYGTQTYLPRKTMMVQNVITYDIYENQIVLGFLAKIVNVVNNLEHTLLDFLDGLDIAEENEDGYLISSYLIFKNAGEQLLEYKDRLKVLEDKFNQLYLAYNRILNVTVSTDFTLPKPTSVFLNVQQYSRIYYCILNWFKKDSYDFQKERIMMNFFNAPEIFEVYSLVKLISEFKDNGFDLIDSKHFDYPLKTEWKYVSKKCNNTFYFQQEDKKITLYYEPVIYDYLPLNDIDLYRNNTVSLGLETDEERHGHYYVPDYIIKYSVNGHNEYLICDAKFTYRSKVRTKEVPKLSYKYLTSISPINQDSIIKGLYVFYGITDDYVDSESFYDVILPGAKEILPTIRLVPVSEDISYTFLDKNFLELIGRLYR